MPLIPLDTGGHDFDDRWQKNWISWQLKSLSLASADFHGVDGQWFDRHLRHWLFKNRTRRVCLYISGTCAVNKLSLLADATSSDKHTLTLKLCMCLCLLSCTCLYLLLCCAVSMIVRHVVHASTKHRWTLACMTYSWSTSTNSLLSSRNNGGRHVLQ